MPYPDAFQRILNASLEEIVDDWGTSIRRTYLPLLSERREAREEARPLITFRGEGGRVNVAPVISPDGKLVAFLSELEFLDVEMYIANAETGEIIRRLVRGTAFDPHYGSLRYINSAGTWSPDSRRFAFSALRNERDVVVDDGRAAGRPPEGVRDPRRQRDHQPHLVAGRQHHRGVGAQGRDQRPVRHRREHAASTRQLTDDRFADLQPMYSPDGRTIAFATDRGETDFNTLTFGEYRLALMDVASGRDPHAGPGRRRPAGVVGKNINPQWSRDSRALFFISDRTGISNVYRMELATGGAHAGDRPVHGRERLHGPEPGALARRRTPTGWCSRRTSAAASTSTPSATREELAGTAPVAVQTAAAGVPGVPLAALLPPVPRPEEAPYNRVLLAVNEFQTGLPDPEIAGTWTVIPYRPRISLDYLGQPSVGATVSTGGFSRGGLYGGISGIFSDILGYHNIYGTVQAQGQIDEIGFSAHVPEPEAPLELGRGRAAHSLHLRRLRRGAERRTASTWCSRCCCATSTPA